MNLTLMAIYVLVGALGFRARGAEYSFRHFGRFSAVTRMTLWVLPMAFLAWAPVSYRTNLDIGWYFVFAIAWWVGSLAPWWGSLDMDEPMDLLLYSIRGVLWVLPVSLVYSMIGQSDGWWLCVGGLMCGLCYVFGFWLIAPDEALINPQSDIVDPSESTEIGELLFGAVVGFFLWMTLF